MLVDGVSFYGLGYEIPRYNQLSWNAYLSEADAEAMLNKAKPYDVLVTHTPPLGHVDVEVDDDHNGRHDGSAAILYAVETHKPKFHLCGHMHDSWGQSSRVGPTLNWFTL